MVFPNYTVHLTVLLTLIVSIDGRSNIVYQVKADEFRECCSIKEKSSQLPPIYCFSGNEKKILNVFQTITVSLIIDKNEDFIVYLDVDNHLVEEQLLSDEVAFSLNKVMSYFWKQKDFRLDPFQPSCFSIKTTADYKIKIHSLAFDSRRLSMFVIGLLLFRYSARLSHNSLFYYLCGITIGVSTSLIVIILLISRLIPKKTLMLGFLGTSSMLSLYAIQMLIENLNMIFMLYFKFILGYIFFSILVSFIVCYRYGPVTDPRSIDLIRWTLQLIGLAMVTLCSYHLEAMVFIDILSILFYYTKFSFTSKSLFKSKPKMRLLSEDEYIQQSLIETPKALEELRKYCKSTNCDTWKIVNKLRDPKKFSEFMETSAHVSTEVVEEYERDYEDKDESGSDESTSDTSDSFDDIKELETSDNE